MTGGAHVLTELGGYVLGGLEPAEAAEVREHLASCAECAAEHARLAGLPRLLDLGYYAEDAPPLPPAVEERVLDAVSRERGRPAARRRRRLRLTPRPLLAGAAVLAVGLAALVLALGRGDDAAAGYPLALHPVGGATAAGRAELSSTSGGTSVHLWVRGLPADPRVVYEVECDAPHWTASAGTFRADAHGRAYVELTTAARRGEYDAIRVVRRSAGATTDVLSAQL